MKQTLTTRAFLAVYWSVAVSLMSGYIIYRWGDEKEILTLMIGFLTGGIMGAITGVYFGADHRTNPSSTKPGAVTGEISATITSSGTEKTEEGNKAN